MNCLIYIYQTQDKFQRDRYKKILYLSEKIRVKLTCDKIQFVLSDP